MYGSKLFHFNFGISNNTRGYAISLINKELQLQLYQAWADWFHCTAFCITIKHEVQ